MTETVSKIAAVATGGALGAVLRYGLNSLLAKTFPAFPFATFFINVTGSFLLGLLAAIFAEKYVAHENWRLFLTVGFLGAYTTFSTFELETFNLMREKQTLTAFAYVSASFAVGFLGVIGGAWLGRKL